MRKLPTKTQVQDMESMQEDQTEVTEEPGEKPAKKVMKAIGKSILSPKKKKVKKNAI